MKREREKRIREKKESRRVLYLYHHHTIHTDQTTSKRKSSRLFGRIDHHIFKARERRETRSFFFFFYGSFRFLYGIEDELPGGYTKTTRRMRPCVTLMTAVESVYSAFFCRYIYIYLRSAIQFSAGMNRCCRIYTSLSQADCRNVCRRQEDLWLAFAVLKSKGFSNFSLKTFFFLNFVRPYNARSLLLLPCKFQYNNPVGAFFVKGRFFFSSSSSFSLQIRGLGSFDLSLSFFFLSVSFFLFHSNSLLTRLKKSFFIFFFFPSFFVLFVCL